MFNDDDWYVYDAATLKIVRVCGKRAYAYSPTPIDLGNGLFAVRGLRAKSMGLNQ